MSWERSCWRTPRRFVWRSLQTEAIIMIRRSLPLWTPHMLVIKGQSV